MVKLQPRYPDCYHSYDLHHKTMFWFNALFNHVGELCSLLGHRVLLINGLAYIDEDIEERKNPMTYDSLMFVYPKCIYNWVWEDYHKRQDVAKSTARKEKVNG